MNANNEIQKYENESSRIDFAVIFVVLLYWLVVLLHVLF